MRNWGGGRQHTILCPRRQSRPASSNFTGSVIALVLTLISGHSLAEQRGRCPAAVRWHPSFAPPAAASLARPTAATSSNSRGGRADGLPVRPAAHSSATTARRDCPPSAGPRRPCPPCRSPPSSPSCQAPRWRHCLRSHMRRWRCSVRCRRRRATCCCALPGPAAKSAQVRPRHVQENSWDRTLSAEPCPGGAASQLPLVLEICHR